ncbi:MAG: hypothetical protein ACLPV2_16200 [Steroidobacteraceae bacterium]
MIDSGGDRAPMFGCNPEGGESSSAVIANRAKAMMLRSRLEMTGASDTDSDLAPLMEF